jgi:hypothetical protein
MEVLAVRVPTEATSTDVVVGWAADEVPVKTPEVLSRLKPAGKGLPDGSTLKVMGSRKPVAVSSTGMISAPTRVLTALSDAARTGAMVIDTEVDAVSTLSVAVTW